MYKHWQSGTFKKKVSTQRCIRLHSSPTYTSKHKKQEVCGTRSWNTSHSLATSSTPSSTPLIRPWAPAVSRRKQKRRQNNLLSGQFQTIRRVLWPSSSSPASSRANPRTPLWSSPGLSVGAAMHTVSIKQSQSHHSLLYSFQTNKSCCLQGEDQVTSENTLMHREI